MKIPVYLHKTVEDPDKIIVRYTNFGDVRNGRSRSTKPWEKHPGIY